MNSIIAILQLLPELIKAIEGLIPGDGKGEQKLALLRQWIESANAELGPLWPQIAAAAGLLVKVFNLLGVFKKG